MKLILSILFSLLILQTIKATASNANTTCSAASIASGVDIFVGHQQCIHPTCHENLPKAVQLFTDTETVLTPTYNGSVVSLSISNTLSECGAGTDQPCVTTGCFKSKTVYETNNTEVDNADPTAIDISINRDTQTSGAQARCTQPDPSVKIFNCPIRIEYSLHGTDNLLVATKKFTLVIEEKDGAVKATLSNVVNSQKALDISTNYTPNIQNEETLVTGTLRRFTDNNFNVEVSGPQVNKISTGETIYLTLRTPTNSLYTYITANTKVTLTSASSKTIEIDAGTVSSHQIDTDAWELRLATPINLLGTYDLKVLGELDSPKGRLLIEQDSIVSSDQLKIEIQEPQQNTQFWAQFFLLVGGAIIGGLCVHIYQNVKQIKQHKFQQLQKIDVQN